jgi:hypothetical protein
MGLVDHRRSRFSPWTVVRRRHAVSGSHWVHLRPLAPATSAKLGLAAATAVAVLGCVLVFHSVATRERSVGQMVAVQSSSARAPGPGAIPPPVLSSGATPSGFAASTTTADPSPTLIDTGKPTTPQHGAPAGPRPTVAATSAQATTPTSAGSTGSGGVEVSGQVACTSGRPVVGVWVQADAGSGFASRKGLGDGSTSDYWYWLSTPEPYALHVGCGGSPSSWAVAVYSSVVGGTHNSFDCVDVSTNSGYGKCFLR